MSSMHDERSTSESSGGPQTRAELREAGRLSEPRGLVGRVEARRQRREQRSREKQDAIDGSLIGPDGAYISRRTLMARRQEARERVGPTYILREMAVVLCLALFLSFALKTWVVQPFFIPSESMQNTLQKGDRVLVSKLGSQALQRGDVVVFADPGGWMPPASSEAKARQTQSSALHDALVFVGLAPNEAKNHLIKRVIGLPGDHVTCCTKNGRVAVNGIEITEPYIMEGNDPSTVPFDIRVPQNKVWVMGDHRGDSLDSRFHPLGGDGSQGSVPKSEVVGRAVAIAWPLGRVTWLARPVDTFAAVTGETH